MLDVAAIKARAIGRAITHNPANPAKRLIEAEPISQLAALATPERSRQQASNDEPAVPKSEPAPTAESATSQPEKLLPDKALSPCTHDPREARRPHVMRWFQDEDEVEQQLDRLDKRDANGDDLRMCLECSHLLDGGRCLAASRGHIRGADRRLEPVRDLLQRCEAFGLRKGLT